VIKLLAAVMIFCNAAAFAGGEMFWNGGDEVKNESLLFIQSKPVNRPTAESMFAILEVSKITNPSTGEVYKPKKDYIWNKGSRTIELPKGSSIKFLKQTDLFKNKGSKNSIPYKVGDPKTSLLFYRKTGFLKRQVEVTYKCSNDWRGIKPKYAGKLLPKTIKKLSQDKKLRITLTGDSISAGWNSSGRVNIKPFLPAYPQQFRNGIAKHYKALVVLNNFAVPGWTSGRGLLNADKVTKSKPDLVIIAYGMNCLNAYKNADIFESKIKGIMEKCRKANPEVEFMVISPMLGNPEWSNTPWTLAFKYRDKLLALEAQGTAVADLTTLWRDILKRKDYMSMTGNGVNHPNDFGHALYANFLLQMLIKNDKKD
jgi:lysophospholipase L1-like esterase